MTEKKKVDSVKGNNCVPRFGAECRGASGDVKNVSDVRRSKILSIIIVTLIVVVADRRKAVSLLRAHHVPNHEWRKAPHRQSGRPLVTLKL